jgi:TPP-dependent pyruvate/acetoin dehydrogenase alpha subunit
MSIARVTRYSAFDAYRDMLLIRRVEEKVLVLFEQGKVSGTTHVCIGQEANAVGLFGQLDASRDYVLSNHRNHGHYLAFGGPVDRLLAEIMGSPDGLCGGRGGSQHVKYGHFMSSGVQGGIVPVACGVALAEKIRGTDGVVVVCIGDGTLGQGVLYESLNLAGLWDLPVLFFVENNRYAQSTPVEKGVKGSIVKRATAFDISAVEIESTDVEVLLPWLAESIHYVRRSRKPIWAVVHTYRLAAHSKGDDTRDPDEIRRFAEADPLKIQVQRLSTEEAESAERWVQGEIVEALRPFIT